MLRIQVFKIVCRVILMGKEFTFNKKKKKALKARVVLTEYGIMSCSGISDEL